MKHALIYDSTIREYRDYDIPPDCKHIDGLPVLRPVVEMPQPAYAPDLQRLDQVVTIFDDRVEHSWTAVSLATDEIIANLDRVLVNHLHTKARERNYDSIHTAALRAGYPGPFHDEGVAYATWMDACNATAYQIMADVQAGLRAIPTGAELIAEMPALVLP
jgi:hypothetical protein